LDPRSDDIGNPQIAGSPACNRAKKQGPPPCLQQAEPPGETILAGSGTLPDGFANWLGAAHRPMFF